MRQIGESINRTTSAIQQRLLKYKRKARNYLSKIMILDGIQKKI